MFSVPGVFFCCKFGVCYFMSLFEYKESQTNCERAICEIILVNHLNFRSVQGMNKNHSDNNTEVVYAAVALRAYPRPLLFTY